MTTVPAHAVNHLDTSDISSTISTHPASWQAPDAVPDSIMVQLRRETRSAHERIEQVACLQRLFAADYTLTEYYQLLLYWYGFYKPFEEKLFSEGALYLQCLPNSHILLNRRKGSWLKADLMQLGQTMGGVHAASPNTWVEPSVPLCEALPEITHLRQVVGAFYVLEGATLGGQLIRRRLIAHFGPSITHALHFYSSYGDAIGTQWRAFGELMRGYQMAGLLNPTDEVIAAANHTFEALTQWLDGCGN